MSHCTNCGLVVLEAEIPVPIQLPDEPFCCCEEPELAPVGLYYDGFAIYDGTYTYV